MLWYRYQSLFCFRQGASCIFWHCFGASANSCRRRRGFWSPSACKRRTHFLAFCKSFSSCCCIIMSFKSDAIVCGLRVFLLVHWAHTIHRPPHSLLTEVSTGVLWGVNWDPTRVALHPGRVVKEPERQPYIHWTTCYDYRGDEEYRAVLLHPSSDLVVSTIYCTVRCVRLAGFLSRC